MNHKEYLKWIMPSVENRSVSHSEFRFMKAVEQAEMKPTSLEDIIEFVNIFLDNIGMDTTKKMNFNPEFRPEIPLGKGIRRINYAKIKETNHLKDKNDIVWIKFTRGGYISVIGTSCDISFSKWAQTHTTAGRISMYLTEHLPSGHRSDDFEWDDRFVLIFPLKKIPNNLNRSDIESGIGNYLIHRGVPILDFYSHNY